MVRFNLDDIHDDMVLGESITLPSGKLLLGAGYRVTKRYRQRLKELGFRSILVDVAGTEDIKPTSVVLPSQHAALCDSMAQVGESVETVVAKFRDENAHDMHKLIFQRRRDLNNFIMSPTIARQLETIIDQILNQPEIILNMSALKASSSSFFERSVNVTITSLCIGRKNKLSYEEIKQLATGALNYHVGLLALPKALVEKTTPFTDEERKLFHQHTVYGYLMLAQNPQISPTSAIVALQHHEYQNGSGYPLGLKGDNQPPVKNIAKTHMIHRFAEIVAVADAYHALAPDAGEVNAANEQTRTSIKQLIQLSGENLNSEIVKTLVSIIPAFPIGTRVRITEAPSAQLSQYIGVVAKDNPDNLARPVILLYETLRREKVDPPIIIDTAKTEAIKFELMI